MKLLGWMQNKLNGSKQEIINKKPNAPPPSYHKKQEPREEFNDWPHGLLAIGTFGNNPQANSKRSEIHNIHHHEEEETSSSMDLQDFTPEEIGKFEKELTKLLRKKKPNSSDNKEKEINDASLPLDRFLNCPSTLEVSRRMSTGICSEISDKYQDQDQDHDHDQETIKDEDIDRTISVILGRCKDIRSADNNKKANIGRKSVSFLLKKMFVCRGGFAPQPSLRDTLQESRMERFLRVMLHKKMSAQQNSSRASSMKKYLEDSKQVSGNGSKGTEDDKLQEKNNSEGCKWVKTDSEYIVLEI